MIKQVRKKPILVEAVQFTGTEENVDFLWTWSERQVYSPYKGSTTIMVKCLEALAETPVGSYIIKGVKGEVWPVREDIFNETYEIIDE